MPAVRRGSVQQKCTKMYWKGSTGRKNGCILTYPDRESRQHRFPLLLSGASIIGGAMKALLTVVFLLSAGAAFAQKPKGPSDCFKVHALIRADEAHYWADWTNACPYTIDSVYVLVTFADKSKLHVGDGVWPMYFVTPGHISRDQIQRPCRGVGFCLGARPEDYRRRGGGAPLRASQRVGNRTHPTGLRGRSRPRRDNKRSSGDITRRQSYFNRRDTLTDRVS